MVSLTHRSRCLGTVSLVGIVFTLLVGCGEQRRERFASGAAALTSDTANRGWIPPWLPPEAANVDIRYDLDTNYRWLSFRLEPSVAETLQRQLSEMHEHQIGALSLPRPRGYVDWPDGLIQQQPANDAALYARVFCGTGRSISTATCFAFEQGSTDVYVWIPRDDL